MAVFQTLSSTRVAGDKGSGCVRLGGAWVERVKGDKGSGYMRPGGAWVERVKGNKGSGYMRPGGAWPYQKFFSRSCQES